MESNETCYNFEKRKYNNENPLFIDATYIIHLTNNTRYEHIEQQLEHYQPSNIVYILHNNGYKNCKKQDFIDRPAYDLVDAFLQVFKHAKAHNYQNILVLEDDFIFNEKIKNTQHIKNINHFLIDHNNASQPFIYLLGCIPYIQIPYDYNTNIVLSGGTHACIYSKQIREQILKTIQTKIKDWDLFCNFNYVLNKYTYYTPLCYQLFPETDNAKQWGDSDWFTRIIGIMLLNIFKMVGLDKNIEPGYSIFYGFSKFAFYFLIIIIIVIIYISLRKILTPKNLRNIFQFSKRT
jgi:hypothetical protein